MSGQPPANTGSGIRRGLYVGSQDGGSPEKAPAAAPGSSRPAQAAAGLPPGLGAARRVSAGDLPWARSAGVQALRLPGAAAAAAAAAAATTTEQPTATGVKAAAGAPAAAEQFQHAFIPRGVNVRGRSTDASSGGANTGRPAASVLRAKGATGAATAAAAAAATPPRQQQAPPAAAAAGGPGYIHPRWSAPGAAAGAAGAAAAAAPAAPARSAESDPYTGEDVKKRTQQWLLLAQQMRAAPDSPEFVYLKCARPKALPFNPFDLQVTTHHDAAASGVYLTLSPAGFTRFTPDGTEFLTHEQWEREYLVHMQLMQLCVFKQYRLWRPMALWRKVVRDHKSAGSSAQLQKALCCLKPVLREALYATRHECFALEACSRTILEPGQPITLQQLSAAMSQHLQQVQAVLGSVAAEVTATAKEACQLDLDQLAAQLMQQEAQSMGFLSKRGTVLSSTGEPGESSRASKAPGAAASLLAGSGYMPGVGTAADVPYAVQAARRSEKRRLLGFVKRLELMVADGARTALLQTTAGMLQAIQAQIAVGTPKHNQVTVLPLAADIIATLPGVGPVLQLDILLRQDGQLALWPGKQEWAEQLDTTQRSTAVLARGAPRLVLAPELQQYLELPTEGLHLDMEGLLPIILGEAHTKATEAIFAAVTQALAAAEAFMHGLDHLQQMVARNNSVTRELLEQQVAAGVKGLPELRADLQNFHAQLDSVKGMPAHRDLGILRINLTRLKDAVAPSPQRCIREIHQLLPRMAEAAYKAFVGKLQDYTSRLLQHPTTPEEFAEFLKLMQEVEQQQRPLDKEHDQVLAHYELMEEFKVEVPSIQLAAVQDLDSVHSALRDAQWAAESAKDRLAQMFRVQLYDRAKALQEAVQDVKAAAGDPSLLDGNTAFSVAMGVTSGLLGKVHQQLADADTIRQLLQVCGGRAPEFDLLEEVAGDVELKHGLWNSKVQWANTTDEWLSSSFIRLDANIMEDQVARIARQLHKYERSLPPNTATPPLRDSVTEWQAVVPVVGALRNQHLKERHWDRINSLLTRHFDKTAGTTLSDVLGMQVMQHSDALVALSNEATQEAALEAVLGKVLSRWRDIDFCVNPYKEVKDMYTLGALDEVLQALEDSRVTLSTILASRYVAGIRAEVDRLDRQLKLLAATLDVWLLVQKGWMSLEAVFGAPDIQRQLPSEARAFAQVDKTFKDIMRRTHDRPNALQCCQNAGWLEALTKCHDTLEVVARALEDYFETKRLAFPRFYFLSNEELLDILSQVKNPAAVQPHLQKCFDGIRRLEMRQEEHGLEVAAMISAEGARLGLVKPVKARGLVEVWLHSVESSMRLTLRTATKAALKEYGRLPREQWALQHPGQLVTLVSNIFWCQSVELALGSDQPPQELQDLHKSCALQLVAMTSTVRGRLTDLERQAVVALITADVHNRDVVLHLMEGQCHSAADFAWQRQLRYEYDGDVDTVVIRQVNARFEYGNEYLGCPPRLVITPVTERCYMTLTTALQLKLGGAPAGPAGTGKTETVKDLAKALGNQCVVFNCAEQIDHKLMARFFRGLAQAGAWACFDEFNRIDVEVLSVIAQQLLALQAALRSGTDRCLLDGRELRVLPSCGVFITMNPGYAGRTELPDNLKALFRPVAMTVPDYSLVAEVILLSEGFDQAGALSNKVVQLYKLASEQLSQQDHYDFGMRALKSVLVMAGTLRRSAPNAPEGEVLLQAMRDANLPKFLSEDALLFEAIVGDLFPDMKPPAPDQELLQGALAAACAAAGLQPCDPFLYKAVQLQQTLALRFGVMVIGPTGSGKTRCYEVLQGALQQMAQEQVPGARPARVHILNPKSIDLGELYGSYNVMTNEWKDGLASGIIRTAAAAEEGNLWEWVVFDGPVDTLWTESLNTVLDDNCMLCLPNGERVKLDAGRLRMLFEVEDLAAASPATVSRCGMVYMPSDVTGWTAAALSWVQRVTGALPLPLDASSDGAPAAAGQAASDFLWGLFQGCVQPLLDWLSEHGKEPIGCNDAARIGSMLAVLDAQLKKYTDLVGADTPLTSGNKVLLQYLFAFAAVWGLGGALDSTSWPGWDKAVRSVFDGTANFPQGAGTVMDYYVETEGMIGFAPWADKVEPFKYSPDQPFSSILVPTVNTTRYTQLLKLCCSIDRPVLMVGLSGVGKSVIMQQQLARTPEHAGQLPVVLHCSASTTSPAVQQLLDNKLVRQGNTFAAPDGQRLMLFLDDINLPAKEQYGAQPPLELLRSLQDKGGMYDRRTWQWKAVSNVLLLGACGPPGGGRQEMSARITRPFTLLAVAPPDEGSMRSVCSSILTGFLDHYFTPDVRSHICKPMAEACVEVFLAAQAELLPTPAHSHYVFSFRHVSRVLQGLLAIRVQQCGMDVRGTLQKLFVHEHLRVYGDSLVSSDDLSWLEQLLWRLLRPKFDCRLTQDQVAGDTLLFGDFIRIGVPGPDRAYEELPDLPRVVKVLHTYLEEYNLAPGRRGMQGQLQLVLFKDAVQHIVRLARILRQARGHALLVGVAGSGKQTLSRFAAYVAEVAWHSIELRKGYGLAEFREDLKAAMRVAGVSGKPVAFLLTDSQMADPAFLGDVNSLLNTGEITGLWTAEETAKVLDDIRPWLTQQEGLGEGHEAAWAAFVNRCRDNLHLILTMSPVGDAFRTRCRQFPSLTGCATIDWYHAWPAEALLSVGSHYLEAMDLGNPQLVTKVAQLCVDAHTSVEAAAGRFYQELRRRYYVTPKMFLDLVSLYDSLLRSKQAELEGARARLLCGIQKLQETNAAVDVMTQQLNDLQPLLAEKTGTTQKLLEQVAQEQEEAVAVAAVVAAEEAEVAAKAAETAALKDDAAADLAVVLPELENAVKALDALNKADVIEMKTFLKPPALVQLTMEGVCLLLQEKTDWDAAKRVLSDPTFIKRLVEYDKDNIPDKVSKALKRVVTDPAFTPELVGKQSKAAMSMCMWVRAMDTYCTVFNVVEPKRRALEAAQAQLDASNEVLATKRQQLQDINDKAKELQAQLAAKKAELASLQHQAELSALRLNRAGILTQLLGSEVGRWEVTAGELKQQLQLLTGDTFLCAASISYLGAFTGPYRQELVAYWQQRCSDLQVAVSEGYSLSKLLVSPVELRDWALQGLPTDGVSVDNGTLVTRTHRWPLMIDPQEQGRRWIRTHEAGNGLVVVRSGDPRLMQSLEACIRTGAPLLLEGCGEVLDPGLTPLLARRTFKHGGRLLIRLGDADVDYDPAFKLYMATSIANPHFLPEACIQVNLVNFTVTCKGLEDQLLGELVRQERPELEEQRDRLVVSIAADKKQLVQLEDRVLKLLKDAAGNILDDEVLITTLNNSKATSAAIQARVKESEQTEQKINATRDEFRLPPSRASLLWFIIADLVLLDPMYQYSLAYFCTLFKQCIASTPACSTLAARLENLVTGMTSFMYRMVCRGLFEAHKQVFSLLIAATIQREAGEVTQPEWDFFLRDPSTLGASSRSSSSGAVQHAAADGMDPPAWMPGSTWGALQVLAGRVPAVSGLLTAVVKDPGAWQARLQGDCPALTARSRVSGLSLEAGAQASSLDDLAAAWGAQRPLTDFQKVLLVKVLWPDSLLQAIQTYIRCQLGPAFLDSPAASLQQVYADSSCKYPVVFILSQGMDPTTSLARLAASQGRAIGKGLHLISLGQGQGPVAESVVRVAMKTGDWVCLQNCHLAKSWMPNLQLLVEDLANTPVSLPPAGWSQSGQTASADGSAADAEGWSGDGQLGPSRAQSPHPAAAGGSGAAGAQQRSLAASPTMGEPAATGRRTPGRLSAAVAAGSQDGQQQEQQGWLHPNFRLWLTSLPAAYFPAQVLQSGIKITLEAPRGVRANMLRCYGTLSDSSLAACDACGCGPHYRRLVFLLSLTHALLLERGRFGPMGWSKPYEFSDGDFSCSLQVLQGLLQHAAADRDQNMTAAAAAAIASSLAGLPLAAVEHMWGHIVYGGRVTDASDMRLLQVMLQQQLRTELLAGTGSLTGSGVYGLPADGKDVLHFDSHIRNWPAADDLQLFGLHSNAGLALQQQEARQLLESVLCVQPREVSVEGSTSSSSGSSSSGGSSSHDTGQQQLLMGLVPELLKQLPPQLQLKEASILHNPFAPLPSGQINSLGTVLRHEIDRYNQLLAAVSSSLQELGAAMNGLVAMSADLELVAAALRDGRVPAAWQQRSYPAQQSLAPWVSGLAKRVHWLRRWLTEGTPNSFWLSGLFFPEGFLTAVLQNHARTYHTPIDRVALQCHVQPAGLTPDSITQPPAVGVYIHGLWLEAASWDASLGLLAPAVPRTPSSPLPVVHLMPVDTLVSPSRQPHPLDTSQQQQQSMLASRQRSQPVPQQQHQQRQASSPLPQQQQRHHSSPQQAGWYECPLYKTSARSGALRSRGTSSALVMHLQLPAPLDTPASFWILQGTAAVCTADH